MKPKAPKIEKGIPIPRRLSGALKNGYFAAVRSLEIGDSVYLVGKYVNQVAPKVLGKGNFATRKEKEGFRIWRIK